MLQRSLETTVVRSASVAASPACDWNWRNRSAWFSLRHARTHAHTDCYTHWLCDSQWETKGGYCYISLRAVVTSCVWNSVTRARECVCVDVSTCVCLTGGVTNFIHSFIRWDSFLVPAAYYSSSSSSSNFVLKTPHGLSTQFHRTVTPSSTSWRNLRLPVYWNTSQFLKFYIYRIRSTFARVFLTEAVKQIYVLASSLSSVVLQVLKFNCLWLSLLVTEVNSNSLERQRFYRFVQDLQEILEPNTLFASSWLQR